jgi:hypothetical protein
MKAVRKSIVYQRCEDFAGILVNLGYSVITQQDFEFLLKRHIGADPRTVRAYKDNLVEFNFLKPTKEGYEILKEWIPVQKRLEAVAENSK